MRWAGEVLRGLEMTNFFQDQVPLVGISSEWRETCGNHVGIQPGAQASLLCLSSAAGVGHQVLQKGSLLPVGSCGVSPSHHQLKILRPSDEFYSFGCTCRMIQYWDRCGSPKYFHALSLKKYLTNSPAQLYLESPCSMTHRATQSPAPALCPLPRWYSWLPVFSQRPPHPENAQMQWL